MGRPSSVVRRVTDDEVKTLILNGIENYLRTKETYPRQ
jgi:hypothetical protein